VVEGSCELRRGQSTWRHSKGKVVVAALFRAQYLPYAVERTCTCWPGQPKDDGWKLRWTFGGQQKQRTGPRSCPDLLSLATRPFHRLATPLPLPPQEARSGLSGCAAQAVAPLSSSLRVSRETSTVLQILRPGLPASGAGALKAGRPAFSPPSPAVHFLPAALNRMEPTWNLQRRPATWRLLSASIHRSAGLPPLSVLPPPRVRASHMSVIASPTNDYEIAVDQVSLSPVAPGGSAAHANSKSGRMAGRPLRPLDQRPISVSETPCDDPPTVVQAVLAARSEDEDAPLRLLIGFSGDMAHDPDPNTHSQRAPEDLF
jgi:hypothetical protein